MLAHKEKLVVDHLHLVRAVLNGMALGNTGIFGYDDLYQIGSIGLCKAAETYNPEICKFSTYAWRLIKNEILDALAYSNVRTSRECPYVAAEDAADDSSTPSDYLEFTELQRVLDEIGDAAGGVAAKGIKAIGLLAAGYTNREIGEMMGASANNVTAWVAKARKLLRENPAVRELRVG